MAAGNGLQFFTSESYSEHPPFTCEDFFFHGDVKP